MKTDVKQGVFDFSDEKCIELNKPLYSKYENTRAGIVLKLALDVGTYNLNAFQITKSLYKLSYGTSFSFMATLIKTNPTDKMYQLKGRTKNFIDNSVLSYEEVKINAIGQQGKTLRPAQIGAVYSLLAHWSLSKEVATIVLPTGTGKTETMLVSTLADKATRTLVIVPSLELKEQISKKFSTWGILRELGVIPQNFANPTVFTLNKTLSGEDINDIKTSDIIISTPALVARADDTTKASLRYLFSHIYFDEAHHIQASEWSDIKKLFGLAKIVQFTATPYRNDRKPIEGKVVYNYPLSQALQDKCFSKISLISIDEKHPRKKDKVIAEAAMKRLIEDRKRGFIRHKMMVRADSKIHAEDLYNKYTVWFPNEKIVLVHSNIKGRKQIIEDIKKDKYDIIICVDMLKEGFDYPNFKIAAVHGVHKSLSVLLQFIGRFTRTQNGLGDASFVVNYAEENISTELENLFQEGSGWEKVISEIADAKKAEAESLLHFLQGCQPYSGFDSPNIDLNPKLVYPALSCVCFTAESVNWKNFSSSFNLNKYALSQPFINIEENVFYFTTQKREKVKWAKTERMRDQTWDLIAMYYDAPSKILYIAYTEKRFDIDIFVESITGKKPKPLNGDCVFRSFHSIKRLSIVHAGIFKPANHLHRYSRLSGADVTTELSKWKEGKRCQKSDFVGIGFRDGFPVSVGASVKGKIWSPARVGDLKEWKKWCINIGKMITDEKINSNGLLEDSATKTQIERYPDDLVILATDWSEGLYDRIHKLTIETGKQSLMLSECALKYVCYNDNKAEFALNLFDESIQFYVVLGGERGYEIDGIDDCKILVEGLKSSAITLKKFFEENPPTMFLLNGSTISGCIHTNYGDNIITHIPSDRIEVLDWKDVDYKIESFYKKNEIRNNSIQAYMMKRLVERGAKIVFNDDNSGESADIVAVFVKEEQIYFEIVHCKYSKETDAGARLADLYEVSGQAIVSLRYKWRPEELLKHMERRNGTGVLQNKRFFRGSEEDLEEVKKALKYTEVKFEFAIAQPGVSLSGMSQDMHNFLGSIYSTVVEMTETQLKCYFNK